MYVHLSFVDAGCIQDRFLCLLRDPRLGACPRDLHQSLQVTHLLLGANEQRLALVHLLRHDFQGASDAGRALAASLY